MSLLVLHGIVQKDAGKQFLNITITIFMSMGIELPVQWLCWNKKFLEADKKTDMNWILWWLNESFLFSKCRKILLYVSMLRI